MTEKFNLTLKFIDAMRAGLDDLEEKLSDLERVAEPESEEIVLEEWLALDGAHYLVRWVKKGVNFPLYGAIKTGQTRKVKVPK